jgi:hypothetical protein
MTKQLQNEMSDAQLDAISGGSWSNDCGYNKKRDNDCDYDRKKNHCEPQRKWNDDCRPEYRPRRCG